MPATCWRSTSAQGTTARRTCNLRAVATSRVSGHDFRHPQCAHTYIDPQIICTNDEEHQEEHSKREAIHQEQIEVLYVVVPYAIVHPRTFKKGRVYSGETNNKIK